MYTNITINEQTITLNISTPVKSSKWGNEMDKWTIEVVHNGQKAKFQYFTGVGHRTNENDYRTAKFKVESFLYCIFSDAAFIDQYGDDVDNFADDLGYTKVSEALKAFRGCTEIREKLGTLFGDNYGEISDYVLENWG